jgi:hypothetical protein
MFGEFYQTLKDLMTTLPKLFQEIKEGTTPKSVQDPGVPLYENLSTEKKKSTSSRDPQRDQCKPKLLS